MLFINRMNQTNIELTHQNKMLSIGKGISSTMKKHLLLQAADCHWPAGKIVADPEEKKFGVCFKKVSKC